MNLYVGNIAHAMEESALQEVFAEYGEVTSAKIITDRFSGKSRGFGFVEMPQQEEAEKAMEELNGKEVSGRKIIVNEAHQRKPQNRSGGGGGQRFNRGNNNRY